MGLYRYALFFLTLFFSHASFAIDIEYELTDLGNEEGTGRIDDDGTLYSGSNLFNEERLGQIT